VLDETATADRIAEDDAWIPMMVPAPIRWLDLVLVVDQAPSMLIWRDTVREFAETMVRLGAFRTVRLHSLDGGAPPDAALLKAATGAPANPGTINDPTRRRLVLLITDAVGMAWRDGRVDHLLRSWSASGNRFAVISVLPRRLWRGTRLSRVAPIGRDDATHRDLVPVAELSASALGPLAAGLSTAEGRPTGGLFLQLSEPLPPSTAPPPDPIEHLRRFLVLATPKAQRLASLYAAAPLTIPVMRLVQYAMEPESGNSHLAEVFLSGLLYRRPPNNAQLPEEARYNFLPGVREALLDRGDRYDSIAVLTEVSKYVSTHLGQPLDFSALLADPTIELPPLTGGALHFAEISAEVLRRLGPRFAALADRLEQPPTWPIRARTQTPKPRPIHGTVPATTDLYFSLIHARASFPNEWVERFYRRLDEEVRGRANPPPGLRAGSVHYATSREAQAAFAGEPRNARVLVPLYTREFLHDPPPDFAPYLNRRSDMADLPFVHPVLWDVYVPPREVCGFAQAVSLGDAVREYEACGMATICRHNAYASELRQIVELLADRIVRAAEHPGHVPDWMPMDRPR
jgi:hypothetical protein